MEKKGSELVGLTYEPLFPYFKDVAGKNAFRTYPGDFVSTEDGTGIVHTAPGFGEDDQRVLKGTGVPTICPVDAECRFTDEVPDFQGLFVKDADRRSWTVSKARETGKKGADTSRLSPLLALQEPDNLPVDSSGSSPWRRTISVGALWLLSETSHGSLLGEKTASMA